MKILIVAPRYRPYGQFYELPLGLAYISSYLKSKGMDVRLINLNEYPPSFSLKEAIEASDVLCTGGLSVHYRAIEELLNYAKQINPSIKTVVGGGIFSSEPEIMMAALKPDLGIIGEGEEALALALERGQTGIWKAEPIEDLDSLPYPDYEGLGVRGYLDRQLCGDEHYLYPLDKPRCLPIISSRSCPYNCSFCFHPLGRKYRQRSLAGFFKEVEYLIETYQVNMLSVLDELISADPERLEEFCTRMRKYNLLWMTQMRADSVTPDTIAMLKASGCFQISYGIESGSNRILASMNKHITIEQITRALEWTYEAGIGIQGNLIFGDKAETVGTAQESLTWWMDHRRFMVNLTAVIPYPGCELYKYACSRGLIEDRLEYIRKGCPSVPLCANTRGLFQAVAEHRPHGVLPAHAVVERTGEDAFRGPIFRMAATCPHCDTAVAYANLFDGGTNANMVADHYRIACRNCNQRFDVAKGDL